MSKHQRSGSSGGLKSALSIRRSTSSGYAHSSGNNSEPLTSNSSLAQSAPLSDSLLIPIASQSFSTSMNMNAVVPSSSSSASLLSRFSKNHQLSIKSFASWNPFSSSQHALSLPIYNSDHDDDEQDARGMHKRHRVTIKGALASFALVFIVFLILYAAYITAFSSSSSLSPLVASSPAANSLTLVTVVARIEPPSFDLEWEMPVIDLIHFAAIATWYALLPPSSIVIYAAHDGVCTYISSAFPSVRCFYLSECTSVENSPLPHLDCLYRHLLNHVPNLGSHIALINPDIAIHKRFLDSVSFLQRYSDQKRGSAAAAADSSSSWLLVGSRIDVTLTVLALQGYADPRFSERLLSEAQTRGQRHDSHAIDYLVADRSLMARLLHEDSFPPFLASAGQWSNHLLARAMLDPTVHVIDGSETCTVIHMKSITTANQVEPETTKDFSRGDTSTSYEVDDRAIAYNQALAAASPLSSNSPSSPLTSAASNARLGLGVKQRIGDAKYAPLATEGECPDACIVSPRSSGQAHMMQAFTSRVNPDGYLAVLTVNAGYLALAMNWICWAHRISFTNFILLAEDKYSAEVLSSLDPANSSPLTILTRPHAAARKEAADYGSVEFQTTMSYRTEFLQEVLNAGYHFMTADMDAIWLSDPFAHVDLEADLSGQTHKTTKLSGGLVIVRSTELGRSFWRQVIACQRDNAKYLSEHKVGEYEPSLYTEQYCINELYLKQRETTPQFKRTLLDPWLFPDGKFFFDEMQSQHAGVVPVIIHNNWIRGSALKLARQRDWGLLSTNENATQCAVAQPPFEPNWNAAVVNSARGSVLDISLTIRVIAHSDKQALESLLTSLNNLDWRELHSKLALEIDLDRQLFDADAAKLDEIVAHDAHYKSLLELISSFSWRHGGDLRIITSRVRRGRMSQFLAGWPSDAPAEQVVLILDEASTLSPALPIFLIETIQRYYLNASQFDPRLIGVMLESDEAVLGDTYWKRFPSRSPANELERLYANEAPWLYRYQSASPLAQLLFPAPLQAFFSWSKRRSIDFLSALPPATTNAHTTPCVPLNKMNVWYYPLSHMQSGFSKDGVAAEIDEFFESEEVWWAWLLRFMYEQGLYTLATNLPDKQAFVAHPTGKIARFLPSKMHSDRMATIARDDDALHKLYPLPLLSSLPLFESHFQRISNPIVLSVLPNLLPHQVRHQCVQAIEYEREMANRFTAEERKRAEDAVKTNANTKRRGKSALSDEMKAQQKRAMSERQQEEEARLLREQPRMEIEGAR